MLRLAGSRTAGTITWMADERAHAEHVVPRITAAAEEAGRPVPRVVAGLPVAVCDDADEGRERAARLFSVYEDIPTYRRILDRGSSAGPADVSIIGNEATVTKRIESYRDAGVTDLAAAVFAVGDDRAASRRRTRDLLASIAPETLKPTSRSWHVGPAYVCSNVPRTKRAGPPQSPMTFGMMSSRKTAMPSRNSARVSPGIIVVA